MFAFELDPQPRTSRQPGMIAVDGELWPLKKTLVEARCLFAERVCLFAAVVFSFTASMHGVARGLSASRDMRQADVHVLKIMGGGSHELNLYTAGVAYLLVPKCTQCMRVQPHDGCILCSTRFGRRRWCRRG